MSVMEIYIKAHDQASRAFRSVGASSEYAEKRINKSGDAIQKYAQAVQKGADQAGRAATKMGADIAAGHEAAAQAAGDPIEFNVEEHGSKEAVSAITTAVATAQGAAANPVIINVIERGADQTQRKMKKVEESIISLNTRKVLVNIGEKGARQVGQRLLGLEHNAISLDAKRITMDIAMRGAKVALRYLMDIDNTREDVDGSIANIKATLDRGPEVLAQLKAIWERRKEVDGTKAAIKATVEGFATSVKNFDTLKKLGAQLDRMQSSPEVKLEDYAEVKRKQEEIYGNLMKMNGTRGIIHLGLDGFRYVMGAMGKVTRETVKLGAKRPMITLGVIGTALTLKKLMSVRKMSAAVANDDPTVEADADTAMASGKLSLLERQINRLDGRSINLDFDYTGAVLLPRILGDSISSLMELQSVLAVIHAIKIPAFIGAIGGAGTALLSLASAAAALAAGLAQGLAGAFGVAATAAGQFAGGLGLVATAMGASISQMKNHKTAANAVATAENAVTTSLNGIRTAQEAASSAHQAMADATEQAARATEALNMALATEKLRLAQMQNDIEGMSLSQRQMALDLKQAEKDLAEARKSGSSAEIEAAELRVLEIRNQMESNSISMKMAEKELAAARKNGTSELQSAEEAAEAAHQAQEDAAKQSKDAQIQLAQAMDEHAAALDKLALAQQGWGATLTRTQQMVMSKLGQLKARFQETFGTAMAQGDLLMIDIMDLAQRAFPFLGKAAEDNVVAVRRAFDDLADSATAPRQLELFKRFFQDLPNITDAGVESIGNFGMALYNAFVPGLKYGRELVFTIRHASEAALAWSQSTKGQQQLGEIWQHLVKRAKQLGQAAWNTARGIAHLMDAIGETGMTDRMMSGLVNVTDNFADLTAEGTKSRKAIDKFLRATQPALNEMWRIVKRLVDEFFEVTNSIALAGDKSGKMNPLLSILKNIRRAINPIGELIEENMIKLGPKLGPLIFNLAKIAEVFLSTVPPLELLLDALNRFFHWFTRLDPRIQRFVASTASWTMALSSLGLGFGFISAKVVKLGKTLAPILTPFKKVYGWVAKLGTKGWTIISWVTRLTTLIPGVGLVMGALGGPIGLVVAGIAALVIAGAALIANWKKVRKWFSGDGGGNMFERLGRSIKSFVRGSIQFLLKSAKALRDWFVQHWPDIKQTIVNAAEAIDKQAKPVYTRVFGAIKGMVKGVVSWFRKNWPEIKKTFVAVLKGMWRIAKPVVRAIGQFIYNQLKYVLNWITKNWPLIQKTFRTVFNAAWGAVKQFWKDLKRAYNAIRKDNTGTWKTVREIIKATWRIIKEIIGVTIRTILHIMKAVMHAINGDWGKAWKEIRLILSDALKTMKDIVGNILKIIWEIFKWAMNRIWDLVKWAFNKIVEIVKKKIDEKRKKIEDFFQWLGKAWKTFYDNLPKPVQKAMEAVKNYITDKLETGVNNARGILASLMSAIGNVLDAIGLTDLSSAAKNIASDLREPVKMATGGIVKKGDEDGGIANGITPRLVYGEAGEEVYVRTDKYTPQSARALDYANQKWSERGWFRRAKEMMSPESMAHPDYEGISLSGGQGHSPGSGLPPKLPWNLRGGDGQVNYSIAGQSISGLAAEGAAAWQGLVQRNGNDVRVSHAQLSGAFGRTYPNGFIRMDPIAKGVAMAHEFGHALGLGHGGYSIMGGAGKVTSNDFQALRQYYGIGPGAGGASGPGAGSGAGPYGNLIGRTDDTGGGAGIYGPTNNNLWTADTFGRVIEVLKRFKVSANTYTNHPPGYPGLAGKSADFWDYAGRGTPISVDMGNKVRDFIRSNLGTGLSWTLGEGDAGHSGATRHVHATWKGSDPGTPDVKYVGPSGGGDGGFDWLTPILNAMPKIREITGRLGGTGMGIISEGLGQWGSTLPGKILSWLKEKAMNVYGAVGAAVGSGVDKLGNAYNSITGLTLGEAIDKGGFTAGERDTAVGVAWEESSAIANATNGQYRGLFQIGQAAAADVGANYGKLFDPVYNANVAKRYKDKIGSWSPWEAYPPSQASMDMAGAKIRGYGLGGVVPGAPGTMSKIMAHAGERVIPREVNRSFENLTKQLDKTRKEKVELRGRNPEKVEVHVTMQPAKVEIKKDMSEAEIDRLLDKVAKKNGEQFAKLLKKGPQKAKLRNTSLATGDEIN